MYDTLVIPHIPLILLAPNPSSIIIPPQHKPEVVRAHLGQFGLSGDLALQRIGTLSGGQKSRVAFAVCSWRKPHLLVLDEPVGPRACLSSTEVIRLQSRHVRAS